MRNFALLLLAAVVAFSSCKREETKKCDAFDATFFDSWFPGYNKNGATYIYTNDSGSRDTIITTANGAGQAYELKYNDFYPWGGDEPVCDINGFANMSATGPRDSVKKEDSDKYNLVPQKVTIKHTVGDYIDNILEVSFYNFAIGLQISNYEPVGTAKNYIDLDFEQHAEYSFHGKTYTNVVIVKAAKPQNKDLRAKVDKLYMAKGHGIIGYHKLTNDTEYWLAN